VPHAVVDAHKLYYELHGEHAGIPLLLVTGSGGSCRGWLALQVPDFSREHRTLIFDHPGVGGSEPCRSVHDRRPRGHGVGCSMRSASRGDVLAFMGGMVAPGRAAASTACS
jgi:pimeloyl-ACP methyl ester carboxylesterase